MTQHDEDSHDYGNDKYSRHTKAQRMVTPARPTDGNVMVGIQDPEAKAVIPQGTPSPLGKQLQYLIWKILSIYWLNYKQQEASHHLPLIGTYLDFHQHVQQGLTACV